MTRAVASCLFLFSVFLFSCGDDRAPGDAVTTTVQKNRYASWFKISKGSNFTTVVNYLNAEKNDSVVYVLYSDVKPQVQGEVYYVKTPVKKVACLTSVFVGFLNRLGEIGKIAAVDNMDFVSNIALQTKFAAGNVKELARNGQLNIETTLMEAPSVIFMNPGGDKKKDLDKRLLDAGIVPVVCGDYFENSPLARAEWIKFFGLFFGEERKADSLFTITGEKYFALKRSVDTCKEKPTVFTELKNNDTWFIAGGASSTAQFLNDAGATYLWKDNGKVAATAMNMEQVITKALNADYWINLHLCNNKEEMLKMDARYAEFKAFKNGKLFNNNATLNAKGGNAYWEEGLCNPDEILSDLVEIFHPGVQAGKKLKYYKQLQ